MSAPGPSLLELAAVARGYLGHVEDMSDEDRLLLLGQFTGAVMALEARVREVYAEAGEDGYLEALPPLAEVMRYLGAPEDWKEHPHATY